jgi:hypothetical protein
MATFLLSSLVKILKDISEYFIGYRYNLRPSQLIQQDCELDEGMVGPVLVSAKYLLHYQARATF